MLLMRITKPGDVVRQKEEHDKTMKVDPRGGAASRLNNIKLLITMSLDGMGGSAEVQLFIKLRLGIHQKKGCRSVSGGSP